MARFLVSSGHLVKPGSKMELTSSKLWLYSSSDAGAQSGLSEINFYVTYTHPPIHKSIHLPTHACLHPSIQPSFYLTIQLSSIHPSISIQPFIYLYLLTETHSCASMVSGSGHTTMNRAWPLRRGWVMSTESQHTGGCVQRSVNRGFRGDPKEGMMTPRKVRRPGGSSPLQ